MSGNTRRMSSVLRALSRLGPVDVFLMGEDPAPPPLGLNVHAVGNGPGPRRSTGLFNQVRWAVGSKGVPSELVGLDGSVSEAALRTWKRENRLSHDLVWCNRPLPYLAVRRALEGAVVVDLDDLEDRKLLGRLEVGATTAGTWGGRRLPGWQAVARRKAAWNVTGWRNLQQALVGEVDRVVLCSADDVEQSDLSGAMVLPNCYPTVERPVGAPGAGSASLLMVGLMTYRPNADGASWFVESVLPLVQAEIPETTLRIVGEAGDSVRSLGGHPGVTVTGRVDDLGVELAAAGASVVPIRFGGGTRVKILEAWANRVPVISTPAGAAGLSAVNGRDLLLGDDAESFARACIRVIADGDLRERLTANGADRHAAEFACDVVEGNLAEELRYLVANS